MIIVVIFCYPVYSTCSKIEPIRCDRGAFKQDYPGLLIFFMICDQSNDRFNIKRFRKERICPAIISFISYLW